MSKWSLIVVACALAPGCGDEQAAAVAPTGHVSGQLDYMMPDVSDETASAMRAQFKEGPRPFDVIECGNTYEAGAAVPDPPQPSMWLRFDNKIESVASLSNEQKWTMQTWTLDFVGDEGTHVTCADQTVTKPVAGDAWSAFVYPRGLIRHERWLRTKPQNNIYLKPWERRELQDVVDSPWSKAKIERLIEINATSFDSDYLGGAFEWAIEHGDDELAYEVLRHHTPQAACSQDTAPAEAFQQRVSFCVSNFRIECLLAAYGLAQGSSYPQPAKTTLEQLPAGVDRINYGVGMALHYPGTPSAAKFSTPPIIRDRALQQAVLERLDELGRDPNTDPFNRHLVAMAIGWETADDLQIPEQKAAREELASRSWIPPSTAALMRKMARLSSYLAQYRY